MAVEVETGSGVATVTMDRRDALNAFNSEQLRTMLDALRRLSDSADVRCVIITGAGSRAFAAGADIKEMVDKSPAAGLEFARLGHAVTRAIEEMPQPTIAAVNGFALGGGCEIALACDIRLAAENAVFAQPEVSLGIPPGWGGTQRLPRVVGPGMAAEMLFSGRRVGAEEALRIGLVNAVYPADQLLEEAGKLAATIAKQGPKALAGAKSLMSLAFNGQTAAGLDTEARIFSEFFGTPEQHEGMTAFIEKRSPSFGDG